jgi:glycogen operon protein
MLLLGLPVPMLLMGDEFGNTQKGNNNAYCLDNPTTWLDWSLLEKNKETYDCVRFLLKLRRELPMFHRQDNFSGFDHKGLGAPDISNHAKEPWNNSYPYYCRELGILYYGPYLGGKDRKSYYIAFNMHWEAHEFYLPDITKSKKWNVILDTAAHIRKTPGLNESGTAFKMEARSVVLLECPEDKPVPKKARKVSDKPSPKKRLAKR